MVSCRRALASVNSSFRGTATMMAELSVGVLTAGAFRCTVTLSGVGAAREPSPALMDRDVLAPQDAHEALWASMLLHPKLECCRTWHIVRFHVAQAPPSVWAPSCESSSPRPLPGRVARAQ